jgi:hypothetical protein
VAVHTKKDAGRLGNRILREAAYLEAHPDSRPRARVRVARFSDKGMKKVDIVSVAALVGARRSATKARASRANGRLGGRPPKTATSFPRLRETPR